MRGSGDAGFSPVLKIKARMNDIAWIPHPGPQTDFCSRGEFEVLFGGAAGPGKTDCLVLDPTRFIIYSQFKGLLLRRTFPQLQEIIDRCFRLYPLIDTGAYYKASEHRWYWPSGATITLGHMQHENDKYNYQGKEFHYIGIDELTQFTDTQYLYLHSRCRTAVPHIPTRVRATTNPGGVGHTWVKARFVDNAPHGKTYIDPITGMSRVFIPAKLTDNPTLIENDPSYVAKLRALPEIERLRLMDGVWDAFEGQVFTELSQRIHGIDPFDVPPEWEKFMSFDWGYSKPFSLGWYAIDFDGNMYRYREVYGCKKDEKDIGLRWDTQKIARKIYEVEKEKISFRVADPACWSKPPKKGGFQGPSVIEDMGNEGLYFIKADNARILGKQQVHNRFKLYEEIDPTTGEVLSEEPTFYCFNDNKHFWRTIPEIRQDENNIEDVDTDQEDHIYDEFRYACMARPIIPQKVHHEPAGTFQAERKRYIRAKKYAARHGVSMEVAYGRIR